MPITTQSSEQPWQFTDDDVWDILDPNDVLRNAKIEVSKEWFENATSELNILPEIENNINAALALLLILRIAIDLHEYHRTVYLKRDLRGGIIDYNFDSIAKEAFKAANKEQFFNIALSYAHHNEFIKYVTKPSRPLYGTWSINVPMDNILSLSIQGKRFIRQRVGDLSDLPKIEPDEFKNYNPHGVIDKKSDKGIIPDIMPQQSSISQAQAFAQGGSASVINAPIINVAPPDPAAIRAQDVEIERIRQEQETERHRITVEAFRQMAATPAPIPEPPSEQASAKDADAGEHEPKEDVPGDKKSRLRVSEAFRQAMKQAVIAMTSENVNNFSAAAVYGRMQKIDSGLAAPFNPSDMSHGKRELQGDPHKLEFMDSSYKLTEECLAQLGKSASPIENLSKGDSVKKRGKAK